MLFQYNGRTEYINLTRISHVRFEFETLSCAIKLVHEDTPITLYGEDAKRLQAIYEKFYEMEQAEYRIIDEKLQIILAKHEEDKKTYL